MSYYTPELTTEPSGYSQTTLATGKPSLCCSICLSDQNFVNGRKGARYYWVGLTDERTGKWEWVNQTPYIMERRWSHVHTVGHLFFVFADKNVRECVCVVSRRWMPHQPDNWNGHGLLGTEDCAHLHQDGRLNDVHCSTEMNYICQKHSLRG